MIIKNQEHIANTFFKYVARNILIPFIAIIFYTFYAKKYCTHVVDARNLLIAINISKPVDAKNLFIVKHILTQKIYLLR